MLYPTSSSSSYQPFFFQFSSLTSPPIYSSLLQQEMECVEGALKSSRRRELSSQVVVVDELWSYNMQNAASCDDLFVDELLDFSNNDGFLESTEELVQSENDEEESTQLKQATVEETTGEDIKQEADFFDHFESFPSSGLSLPVEELESLEWLSHFVEDSNSEYSASFLAGVLKEKPKVEVNATEEAWVFKTPVPGKARSKRTRTGVRVWPLGSPESSSSNSSSSSSSTTTTTASSSPWLICTNRVFDSVEPLGFEKPKIKKQKKQPASGSSDTPCHGTGNGQPPRRCSHCGVQKTPQWRAGPLGAKTLCNACGVRFKSGRLFPEYRPACSPTFSSELHSNHHRKVVEMRKKKEVTGQVQHGLVQSAVSSF